MLITSEEHRNSRVQRLYVYHKLACSSTSIWMLAVGPRFAFFRPFGPHFPALPLAAFDLTSPEHCSHDTTPLDAKQDRSCALLPRPNMDTAIDVSDASKALDLSHIRFQLIRLEDTVLFHIIERVQFPLNPTIYKPGAIPIAGTNLSFSDWLLREEEALQAKIRRYQAPDEYPFFPEVLTEPILPALKYPKVLWPNDVNLNAELKRRYVEDILPSACANYGRAERVAEAQENWGSAATCDVTCLQALSRRIHFGKFVAESKFQGDPEKYVKLIKANDRQGIDAAITDAAVEKKVLERLRLKAKTYGTDPSVSAAGPEHGKINVEAVEAMYKNTVIPLTKVVEVEYLMQRLKGTQWEQEGDKFCGL